MTRQPQDPQSGQLFELLVERIGARSRPSSRSPTFARDAAKLNAGGFRLERATPVDQFAWTSHFELAAVFRR